MNPFSGFCLLGCILLAGAGFLVGCSRSDIPEDQVFTLYHNLDAAANTRIHVATFDGHRTPAKMSEFFNRSHCEQAQALFQSQLPSGTTVKYWCEKGRFKK